MPSKVGQLHLEGAIVPILVQACLTQRGYTQVRHLLANLFPIAWLLLLRIIRVDSYTLEDLWLCCLILLPFSVDPIDRIERIGIYRYAQNPPDPIDHRFRQQAWKRALEPLISKMRMRVSPARGNHRSLDS